MNKRIAILNIGLNSMEITQEEEITQADKNTNFIELNFDETVELEGWDLIVLFKTPYPVEILADTYNNVGKKTEIMIPNSALMRNGKLSIELSLQKDDKLITINKSVTLRIKRTINGTYLNATIGEHTQESIVEQLRAIQELLNQTDVKIKEYNTNATEKTNSFNTNYQNKMDTLDVMILEYIKENSAELKGEKGDKGEQGIQGIQGKQGPMGPQGPIGQKGDKGDIGPQGEQGKQGIQGEKGADGANGKDGKSAFNEAGQIVFPNGSIIIGVK